MRLKLLLSMVVVLSLVAFCGVMADEAAEAKHEFVGAKKCKMCHKKDGIHPSWETTAHATAYDALTDEEKASDDFKKYYTTGTTAKGALLTGVQCEACHGAGADYKKKKVMEDHEAAVAAGLLMPTKEVCLACHHDKAPSKVAAVAKDFDYEKAKAKGAHTIPEATE